MCLQVPDSKNDFPDWELDELPLLSRPYVPGFLAFGGALLIAALLAATVMVVSESSGVTLMIVGKSSGPILWW